MHPPGRIPSAPANGASHTEEREGRPPPGDVPLFVFTDAKYPDYTA